MKVLLKAEDIKKLLIRKNKSQNWLAHRLELTSGYMSQLLNCSRSPSPKLREKLMKQFPKSGFDDLFVIVENNTATA
jgi:transcriptional regulator with XRE-family HTH domain